MKIEDMDECDCDACENECYDENSSYLEDLDNTIDLFQKFSNVHLSNLQAAIWCADTSFDGSDVKEKAHQLALKSLDSLMRAAKTLDGISLEDNTEFEVAVKE